MADVRNLAVLAMADKTFTVVFIDSDDYHGNKKVCTYTGTLELEGSFAIIREWADIMNLKGNGPLHTKELKAIHVIPAHTISSIDWFVSPVVKMKQNEHTDSVA